MEKNLSEVFSKIVAMENASCYKRLSKKKEEVKDKVDDQITMLITHEARGKLTVSSLYFQKGKKMVKNKMKFYEDITSEIFINGKTVDRRSVNSIEKFNAIIREYKDPVDAREILKTFAKKNGLKLKKRKYALPDEMYVFSSLVIRVFRNALGTEYLLANKRTQEEMRDDIISFGSYKYIQSVEELEELYEK